MKFRKLHKQQKAYETKVFDEDLGLNQMVQEAIRVPGDYNLKNAMAAVLTAKFIGIPEEKALAALKNTPVQSEDLSLLETQAELCSMTIMPTILTRLKV